MVCIFVFLQTFENWKQQKYPSQPSNRPQHTGQKDNESRNLLENRNSGSRNKRPRETSIFPTLLEGFHVSNQEKNTINDFHFKTVQLSTYTIYFSMVNLLESSPFLSNSWVSGAQVEVVIRSQFLLKVFKTCLRILRHTVEMELPLFSSDFRQLVFITVTLIATKMAPWFPKVSPLGEWHSAWQKACHCVSLDRWKNHGVFARRFGHCSTRYLLLIKLPFLPQLLEMKPPSVED